MRDRMPVQRRHEACVVRKLAPFVGRESELQGLLTIDAATCGEPLRPFRSGRDCQAEPPATMTI